MTDPGFRRWHSWHSEINSRKNLCLKFLSPEFPRGSPKNQHLSFELAWRNLISFEPGLFSLLFASELVFLNLISFSIVPKEINCRDLAVYPNLVPRSHSVTGNVRSGKVRQYTIFHWLLKKGCSNAIYAPIGLFRGALSEGLVFRKLMCCFE